MVEVPRVLAHLGCPWMALPAGPRGWAPADLWADADPDGRAQQVRMTYRAGDRVAVVAGAAAAVDADAVASQVARALWFAHLRDRLGAPGPAAVAVERIGQLEWHGSAAMGWEAGSVGAGTAVADSSGAADRPVRLARRAGVAGLVLLAAQGVAAEEVGSMAASLVSLAAGVPAAEDLARRHRRWLAQRWWDAQRTPYSPPPA